MPRPAANTSQSGSGSEDEDEATLDASSISFGALTKAQAALEAERKPQAAQVSRTNRSSGAGPAPKPPAPSAPPRRASKHAPQEMSSRRPVGRVDRDRLAVAAGPRARDPRFSSLTAGDATGSKTDAGRQRADEARAERHYAFLDGYAESEAGALRAALARARAPAEREELARALAAADARRDARRRRRDAEEVVAAHRRKEKELVRAGKKPFYLKRAELKRRALVGRFEAMSDRQVDKAIAKRRKKSAAKERRDVGPLVRRGREEREA